MRHILFTSLVLLANMVLAQETPPTTPPAPVPAPVDPVMGHWEVVSRSCSSGAPVRDNFLVGRDSIMLSFFNGQYDGKTQVGPCTIWVTGNYTTKDNTLRVFNLSGASNCQPQPTFSPITNFFSVNDKELRIYMSTNGYGSSCPAGDMLESVFAHVGQ